MIEGIVKMVGAIVLVMGLVAGVSLLGAYPTKWLVNSLIAPGALTAVFGTPQLTFWQALGLNFMCSFLIKGSNSTGRSK